MWGALLARKTELIAKDDENQRKAKEEEAARECRGERSLMSDTFIIRIVLFTSGILPVTLLGGWGPAGDHSVLPWAVGFGKRE